MKLLKEVGRGPESSDGTQEIIFDKVDNNKTFTVEEFVKDVLEDKDKWRRWGSIRIYNPHTMSGSREDKIEYSNHKIKGNTFRQEVLNCKVASLGAYGGYGCVDYVLMLEEDIYAKDDTKTNAIIH